MITDLTNARQDILDHNRENWPRLKASYERLQEKRGELLCSSLELEDKLRYYDVWAGYDVGGSQAGAGAGAYGLTH